MTGALHTVRSFAFGLWAGAMLAFAFLFAPTAFAHIGPTPAFAATIADTIRKLTVFGYACAAAIVIACLPRIARAPRLWALVAIAAVMTALSWYEVHAIVPLMERTTLATPAYETLHRRSSTVYGIVLLLGLIGFAVSTAVRDRKGRSR